MAKQPRIHYQQARARQWRVNLKSFIHFTRRKKYIFISFYSRHNRCPSLSILDIIAVHLCNVNCIFILLLAKGQSSKYRIQLQLRKINSDWLPPMIQYIYRPFFPRVPFAKVEMTSSSSSSAAAFFLLALLRLSALSLSLNFCSVFRSFF